MALILDIGLKKNIELYNLVEEDILVVADENMLDTMLRNLIFNAIKFIYDNGSVKVLAKKNETETILYVEDTGIGIKTENIERLFHLISDFTTPGTNNEKGTGLGLILCKDLIEKHNGEIGVHTKEGLGSTFWLSFPNKFK
jgi:signal transduction histidine kinase